MTVEIRVNGKLIHEISVINRGPTKHALASDGHADERIYSWVAEDPVACRRIEGTTVHLRRDGAAALVANVCDIISRSAP